LRDLRPLDAQGGHGPLGLQEHGDAHPGEDLDRRLVARTVRRGKLVEEHTVGLLHRAEALRLNADPHVALLPGLQGEQEREEDQILGRSELELAGRVLVPGHRAQLVPDRRGGVVAQGEDGVALVAGQLDDDRGELQPLGARRPRHQRREQESSDGGRGRAHSSPPDQNVMVATTVSL